MTTQMKVVWHLSQEEPGSILGLAHKYGLSRGGPKSDPGSVKLKLMMNTLLHCALMCFKDAKLCTSVTKTDLARTAWSCRMVPLQRQGPPGGCGGYEGSGDQSAPSGPVRPSRAGRPLGLRCHLQTLPPAGGHLMRSPGA